MQIALRSIGRLKGTPLSELADVYVRRLRPLRLDWRVIMEAKGSGPERVKAESEFLMRAMPQGARLIALDLRGENLTSEAFSRLLFDDWLRSPRLPCFVIGGMDGLSEDLLGRADYRLALGRMTLPHSLAAVVLLEQLYRAKTIWRGEPYHH